MSRNFYNSGQWNILCDVCNKKIKASEAKQRWDGFIVCPADFEERQPQDFVRARQDKISVPFSRPRSTDVYVVMNYQYNLPGLETAPNAGVSDVLDRNVIYNRTFSDEITVTDLIGLSQTKVLINSVTVGGDPVPTFSGDRNPTDTPSLTDILTYTLNSSYEINGNSLNEYSIG